MPSLVIPEGALGAIHADLRPTRVLLVDDHEVIRAGLRTLLDREDDIHVVAAAATGEEALNLLETLDSDVAVVDYSLGGMTGVELCEQIIHRHPAISVVMLSSYLQDTVIFSALWAGARAYVCKDVNATELKRAIRSVARGEAVLDPKVAAKVIDWATRRRFKPSTPLLSPQEVQVMRLVARGWSNQEIADELGLALNTTKNYLTRALSKLNCRSRAAGAVVASRRGLL